MLSVQGVTAGYGAGAAVLRDAALEVRRGEVLGLLGRNGAGKTTLCRTILGMPPPRSGDIRIAGESVVGIPTHRIARRGVSYVPQGRQVFGGLTVAQNLRLACVGAGGGDIAAVLAWFPSLRTLSHREAGRLSGGEQQLLAVGRALASRPKLLVLDEPAEGLDPSAVAVLGETLSRVAAESQIAMLLVEQNLELVRRVAGACAFLVEGRITAAEPTRQLTADERTRNFFGL